MKDKKKYFIQIIDRTIADSGMLEDTDSLLAAVSGGPDSTALVLALMALKKKYSIKLGIAHLNHLLRGKEAARDEAFTRDLADRLDLPFHGDQKNIRTLAEMHGLSIEEAGREARYNFFDIIADRHGYTKIATGHNKNDNAEQVLMNLLRGTGPKGLSGIPPIRNNRYIRPLIRVSKNQILEFLKIQHQAYMVDSSNKDMAYLRNRIRYRLMPHLATKYNPEIMEALDRLSHIVKTEENFWEKEIQKAIDCCVIEQGTYFITFLNSRLTDLHPAVLRRVFRRAVLIVKKDLKQISFSHINDVIKFCFNKSAGLSLDLPGQIRVYRDKNTIRIKKENAPLREIGKREKYLRQVLMKKAGKIS